MHVDVDAVGIRTRHIKRFDPTHVAEAMLRDAGVERVLAQAFRALQQAETRGGHDQVQEARHAADRAVALDRVNVRRRVNFETHAAAMTTTAMDDERAHAWVGRTYESTARYCSTLPASTNRCHTAW